MNLYYWSSQYLANYGSGIIVVIASSEQEAIAKALVQLEKHLKEHACELGVEYWEAEEAEHYVAQQTQLYKEDLSRGPAVIESGVLLIVGSD